VIHAMPRCDAFRNDMLYTATMHVSFNLKRTSSSKLLSICYTPAKSNSVMVSVHSCSRTSSPSEAKISVGNSSEMSTLSIPGVQKPWNKKKSMLVSSSGPHSIRASILPRQLSRPDMSAFPRATFDTRLPKHETAAANVFHIEPLNMPCFPGRSRYGA
jgi:hypothetical protein